jgi:hypothetical protein
MVCFYPKVAKIGVNRYRTADGTPDALLIHREIMLAAFGLLYVQYCSGIPLYDYLRLQRMPLFFPE